MLCGLLAGQRFRAELFGDESLSRRPMRRVIDPLRAMGARIAGAGGQETSSAEALLVTAYLVMWALLFGFLYLGWRRQGQVEKRLAALERSVDGGKAPPS
jgi:hypothetical protein